MGTKHACKGCGEKFESRSRALNHARDCLDLDFGESPGDYVETVEMSDDRQLFFTDYTNT